MMENESSYKFLNKYLNKKENTFSAIFIPCNKLFKNSEIYLSKNNELQYKQILKILNCKQLMISRISKIDSSYFYYPDLKSRDINDDDVVNQNNEINEFLNNFLNKKSKLIMGDSILIRSNLDKKELDLNLKQFEIIKFNFLPKLKIFDFENNFNIGSSSDLLTLLFEKSNFNYSKLINDKIKINNFINDLQINWQPSTTTNNNTDEKNPKTIINEMLTVIDQDVISISLETKSIDLKNSPPFFSICKINNSIEIYSNFTKRKDESINNCYYRVLRYLVILQQKRLGFIDSINDDDYTYYNDHLIEIEKYKEFIKKSSNDNLSIIPSGGTSNSSSNTSTTLNETEIDIINKIKKFINYDQEVMKLFGIEINKVHLQQMVYGNGDIINHIIYQNNEGNRRIAKFGEVVTIGYSLYLPNGQVLKEWSILSNITIGDCEQFIKGIHYSLMFMGEGDIVLSTISSEYAYGETGLFGGNLNQDTTSNNGTDQIILNEPIQIVKPFTPIGVLIELKEISKRKRPTDIQLEEMSTNDKIKQIEINNDLAKNYLLKNDDYFKSLKHYKISACYCKMEFLSKMTEDEWNKFQILASKTFTNLAICYDRIQQFENVIQYCKESIKFYESSKAYRLISNSYKSLKQYDKSIENLEIAKEIDLNENTNNISYYNSKLKELKLLKKKENQDEIKMFSSIFNQLSNQDLVDDQDEDDFNQLINNIKN